MDKRILFVLMPKEFQDHEFYVPFTLLSRKGYTIDIAGLAPGKAIGSFGLEVMPTVAFDTLTDADIDGYDALIITGGSGSTTYLWGNEKLQQAMRRVHANKKIVATICYAAIVPVQADILRGKRATVYPTDEAKQILKEHAVTFVDEGVVCLDDDKIITAQGPTYAKAFGEAIIEMIGEN